MSKFLLASLIGLTSAVEKTLVLDTSKKVECFSGMLVSECYLAKIENGEFEPLFPTIQGFEPRKD